MNTIRECFDIILNGGKEESRQAARRVRKLAYSSSASGREKYEEIAAIVRAAPETYTRISEDWRQENFVIAISVIYFLHDMETQPDFLFSWLFQLLQHPNGYIRHAAVKMISHEIGPLTVHIRHPGHKSILGDRLKPEQADSILYSLFASLDGLLSVLWQLKYKRYKYIDSLPASPYKSAQMVLAKLEKSCGQKYIDNLVGQLRNDEFGVEHVDKFDRSDFFDDCAVCQFEKEMQESGKPPAIKGLKNSFRKAKEQGVFVGGSMFENKTPGNQENQKGSEDEEREWMEERGFEYLGTSDNFRIPEWWDCVWRRVPCGKDECRMCGKIKQDRMRHIMKGEDPDDMKSAFEDVGNSLGEALAMVKQHAAEMGIDITNINEAEFEEPPEPDAFPLYQQAAKWGDEVAVIIKDADLQGRAWLLTEAAADLSWYKNTLLAKIYRQLCNRWHLDRGDEYSDVDHKYTKYVLGECLKILEKSLAELSEIGSPQSNALKQCLKRLQELEKPTLAI